MSKTIDVMVKNLKLCFRDKKTLLLLLLIPIMFYSIMGVTFGRSTFSDVNLSMYSVGYINLDANGEEPINEYQSVEFLINTLSNITDNEDSGESLFKIENNYTIQSDSGIINKNSSLESAKTALEDGNISAILVFEEKFQERLNEKIITQIGLLDNGTADTDYNIDNLTQRMVNDFTQYSSINLSVNTFNSILTDINNTNFDYLLVINDNLEINLLYKSDVQIGQIIAFNYTLSAYCDLLMSHLPSSPSVEITPIPIENSRSKPDPSYTIYFLQSVDATSKSILTQSVDAIISGLINYNPEEISFKALSSTISGIVLNGITTGSPGYLLYGMLSIMSFATALLAQEANDGLLRRLKSTKMKDSQLLMGNFFANTVIVTMQFCVGLGVMAMFGWNPYYHDVASLIFGSLANIIALSFFLNSLAFFLVPIFKSPEASGGGVWIFLIPLMMFAGAFFPLELVAPILVEPAKYIPTRMTVLVFQGLFLDAIPLTNSKIWVNILGQLAYGLIFFVLGTRMFKRYTEQSGMAKKKKSKEHKKEKP